MNNKEFKNQLDAIKEAIEQVTKLLPPEYAKISLRLFAENILGQAVNLSENLNYKDAIQQIMKLILAEVKSSNAEDKAADDAETEKETEKPVRVKTKRVQKALMPVDKISKTLFNPEKNSSFYSEESPSVERVPVFVGEALNKEPVNVYVSLNVEEILKTGQVRMREEVILNPDNRAINDAVCSLYAAGNEYFTLDMIYRIKRGTPDSDVKPSDEERKSIEASMRKLAGTIITIDAREEMQKYGRGIEQYEGNLLYVESVIATINNNRVRCYHILREPVLLKFARDRKQIAECDVEFLALPFSATEENIKIRNYLLQQISHMKHNKKFSHVITYAKLYEYLQVEAPTAASLETKYRRIRDKVCKILDVWKKPYKGKCFIYDYEQQKEGSRFSGVCITLTKPRKQRDSKAGNNE